MMTYKGETTKWMHLMYKLLSGKHGYVEAGQWYRGKGWRVMGS